MSTLSADKSGESDTKNRRNQSEVTAVTESVTETVERLSAVAETTPKLSFSSVSAPKP
jgi:hypothetical protein